MNAQESILEQSTFKKVKQLLENPSQQDNNTYSKKRLHMQSCAPAVSTSFARIELPESFPLTTLGRHCLTYHPVGRVHALHNEVVECD
jgi:hypothetical protein